MGNIIIYSVASFILGFGLGFIFFKKKNNDSILFTMLSDFKRTIEEYKNQNSVNTKEIKDAIKNAQELTKILTTNQNLKGKFGEDCLEVVLQVCYPSENINYFKQYSTNNSQDKRIKPDYLIKLPNNKSVLIDCKLNLEKYIDYKENQDTIESENKKSEFIKDLNNTINELSKKHYESAKDLNQTDFILMYIPLEPVLTLIYTDKDFIKVVKNANEKNIIIVGNSGVLTVLRLINLLWAQDKQERNIDKIVKIAQSIYELIARHAYNLHQIKQTMENNLSDFNKEYEKISKENKLFKLLQELKEYGLEPQINNQGRKKEAIDIPHEFLN